MLGDKMEKNFISLKNINKIYPNGLHAVHNFSLDIKPHEFIVFVGPSGCGKSTTLRMIAGLEDITSGELYMDGKFANQLSPKDRNIAMVFQSYALYPHMSVFNNLAFGLRMRGKQVNKKDKDGNDIYIKDERRIKKLQKAIKYIDKDLMRANDILTNIHNDAHNPVYAVEVANLKTSIKVLNESKEKYLKEIEYLTNNKVPVIINKKYTKQEIKEKVENAAKILEIDKYLNAKPREMSGGQRQRVALGRAIVRNASIFLMDEPLSNLDAKLRVNMRSEIVSLHNKINTTTIYVTHDQTEAMTMATRIVVMKDGYIQQIGTPKEIYNNPANTFVATFIGSPAMNILNGKYNSGVVTFEDGHKFKLSKAKQEILSNYYKNSISKLKDEINNLEKEVACYDISNLKGKKLKIYSKKKQELEILLANKKDILDNYQTKIDAKEFNIIFGIRPEDIKQVEDKEGYKLSVKLPELLGNKYFIHADFANKDIVMEIMSKELINQGDILHIDFDKDAIHLFDDVTKEGIC